MSYSELIGWWDLSWKGGTFPICLRPAGYFFCPRFQAQARWELEDGKLNIDWGKFGKYEFEVKDPRCIHGNLVPKNEDDETNWRKAVKTRDLSPEEIAILGDGAGTEWEFEWSGGSFPIQFKADGYNHFKCEDFPAHAHWTMDPAGGNKIQIDWAEYGKYDLEITVEGDEKTMSGMQVGGKPEEDWRKGKHLRNMLDNKVVEACGYDH